MIADPIFPNISLELASYLQSARSIVDMVILANEVDADSLLANPFLDLPILTAARGFLAEREFVTSPPSFSSMILMLQLQWSESNLGKCEEILEKMSLFWEGVGVVRRILDQQGRGMFDLANGEALYLDSRTTRKQLFRHFIFRPGTVCTTLQPPQMCHGATPPLRLRMCLSLGISTDSII